MAQENGLKFVELCLRGEVSVSEIEDFIDLWHDSNDKQTLPEFLGMTDSEYALWVEQPDSLDAIIFARKNNVKER